MIPESIFALWPIAPFGAEGDDGGDGGNGGDGGDGGNAADDKTKTGGSQGGKGAAGKADDDDDDDDDDEFAGLTPAEIKAKAKKAAADLKAAKKTAKDAQDILDKQDRDKNDKETNLQKDLDAERASNTTLRATVTKQAIEAAIRDDERYEFHNVEMVASVAVQLNPEITVSDEGKVEGLKGTLAKIAKEHEFMVKANKTKDKSNNGTQQQNGSSGPTGLQPGQGGTSGGGGGDVDTKKLAENYPALASRI